MSDERHPLFLIISAIGVALASFILWPRLDVFVSSLFYRPGEGFFWADQPICLALHWIAYYGARAMGAGFALLFLASFLRRRSFFHIDSKGWAFLFLALMLGPVLVANVALKDHWGRARPREIVEFGGTAEFSPALVPQIAHRKNGSFVSGDGAFGFFLPSFAYVVPSRRARRFFWSGLCAGAVFGAVRIIMGAHFMSDVVFAAFLMLATSAGMFTLMYNLKLLQQKWHSWLSCSVNET